MALGHGNLAHQEQNFSGNTKPLSVIVDHLLRLKTEFFIILYTRIALGWGQTNLKGQNLMSAETFLSVSSFYQVILIIFFKQNTGTDMILGHSYLLV